MKRKTLITMLLLSTFFLFCVSTGNAVSSRELQTLMDKYGKESVIIGIMKLRASHITLLVDGKLCEFVGTPAPEYVTLETLKHDLEKANSDVRDLEDILRKTVELSDGGITQSENDRTTRGLEAGHADQETQSGKAVQEDLMSSRTDSAPHPPPKLSSTARWICDEVIRYPDSRVAKMRHVFISDGVRWREEHHKIGTQRVHVSIYDGKSFYTSLSKPGTEIQPSDLDPRAILQMGYDLIPKCQYLGTVTIRGVECWHYSGSEEGVDLKLWIDTDKQTPRRLYLRMPDGEVNQDEYLDLPEGFKISPSLFDTTKRRPMMLNQIRIDFVQTPIQDG